MTIDDLLKFTRANPWKPFRIYYKYGASERYETIWRPNSCGFDPASGATCAIIYPDGYWVTMDINKITRIETMEFDV
jgi:hypothetical protein